MSSCYPQKNLVKVTDGKFKNNALFFKLSIISMYQIYTKTKTKE